MPSKEPCRFASMCEEFHPEHEMAEKRKHCSCENCRKCAVYWAYLEGYNDLDEAEC